MPTDSASAATPAPGLRVLLPGEPFDTEITVSPVTIQQARRALALHPADKDTESELEYIVRLEAELTILLGPAHDGLADTLPPLTGRELLAWLWFESAGCEPLEPRIFPLRQSPQRVAKSAADLLAFLDYLVATLRQNYPRAVQRVEDMSLASVFSLARSISATTDQRALN